MRKFSVILSLLLLGSLLPSFFTSPINSSLETGTVTQLTHNTVDDYAPSISGDGSKIAYHAVDPVDGSGEIFVINSDETELKQLTSNTCWYCYPSISDDGSKIAFEIFTDWRLTSIYVINSDDSGLLSFGGGWGNYNPCISGDGSKIAFQAIRCTDYAQFIYVINSDGSDLTQLTSTIGGGSPSICNDGSKIAFESDVDGDPEIFVINSDGTGLEQLTSNMASDTSPCISGDGTKIAFTSDMDGENEIFVINFDGTGLKQLTHNTADDGNPSISGDGTKIAFMSDVDGDYEIFLIKIEQPIFDPRINGLQFNNTIPKNAVDYYEAYASLSSASWADSIPEIYKSSLAWFSVAANSLQIGNCFGMVYTAKYYFENPSMLATKYPSANTLIDVDQALIAPEIITNQFPGLEIIDNYLLNDLALYLGIPSVTDQISWILNKIDQNQVVLMIIDVPKLSPIFHHALLAYDYEISPNHVTLKVYDPNEAKSTLFLELDQNIFGNYEIAGGNLVNRYGVTKFVAGDFYDDGLAIIIDSLDNFYGLVYNLVRYPFDDFIRFEARSPVDIAVVAPDGLKVGFDNVTQSEINQIPDAVYSGIGSEPQTVLIPSPIDGDYVVELYGTDSGDYEFLVDMKPSADDPIEAFSYRGVTYDGDIEAYSFNLGSELSTEWNVVLTATKEGYNDESTFGVDADATDGFDPDFDEIDPPIPPVGVESYFYYPDNPISPVNLQKLSVSKIASNSTLNFTYSVRPTGIDGIMNITLGCS